MRHITDYNHKLVCPYCGHPSIGLVQQLSFEVGEASQWKVLLDILLGLMGMILTMRTAVGQRASKVGFCVIHPVIDQQFARPCPPEN